MLFLFGIAAYAQAESDERPSISVDQGFSVEKKDKFLLNLRFRMQSRFGFISTTPTDLTPLLWDTRIRRLRLRFDGYMINHKLGYYIQLSFSKADQDLENQAVPQTIRDGILYYTFNDRFYIGFGQSKLPGNRERVVSSGNLQFADRSIMNGRFTLDRDFGFFAYYNKPIGNSIVNLKGAITSGEGRNSSLSSGGLSYTGRVEYLPFGSFKGNGDYSEGDLEHETTPKLSIAATYNYNDRALRSAGQLGNYLFEERTMEGFLADAMFKYAGWAWMTEYAQRTAKNPILIDTATGSSQYIYVGNGMNTQLSYCFPSLWEIAGRYSYTRPFSEIASQTKLNETAIIGVTKYFNKHRIKAQMNVGYIVRSGNWTFDNKDNKWDILFQVEFGI